MSNIAKNFFGPVMLALGAHPEEWFSAPSQQKQSCRCFPHLVLEEIWPGL
jgi:hypothetical protein